MMVKSLYTHVAVIAVCGSRRSEYKASVAKLYFLRVRFNRASIKNGLILADLSGQVFLTDRDPPQVWVLKVAKYFGDYPRVDDC